MYRWREEIVARGLAERGILGHHPGAEGLAEFHERALAWPSRWVGLQGVRPRSETLIPMNYLEVIRPLYEAGVRVHGFAMIKSRYLKQFPFYSADSTSWAQATHWGQLCYADGGDLRSFRFTYAAEGHRSKKTASLLRFLAASEGRLTWEDVQRSYVVDGVPMKVEQRVRFLLFAAEQYRILQEQLGRYWKAKGVDWEKQRRKTRRKWWVRQRR